MRVFYCTPTDRPDLTGATPDVDEALEMARALMLGSGTRPGFSIRLHVGEMSKDDFEAWQRFPLEELPRFVSVSQHLLET